MSPEPSQKSNSITKDMLLADIAKKFPSVVPVLFEYGLHCIGCHLSPFETLEEGCKGHGMPDDVFEQLLKDINAIVTLK
ncbi:MAG: DUF1858 domain-containing protein [archaeon]